MISAFLNTIIIVISLTTAVSVLVHDMHIDKVATTAITGPVNDSGKAAPITPDLHTHPDRHSFMRLGQRTPTLQPRVVEDKKHMLQKHIGRGHHPFDNYSLPIA